MNSNGQTDIGYWQMIERQKDPVAWITMSGLSYQRTGLNDRPLYTHPNEADLGVAEAIGFDKGYKAATEKTLTDKEILKIADAGEWHKDEFAINFARAILKKASEK